MSHASCATPMAPEAHAPYNPFDLDGRVAMVTGCHAGIGAQIAVALARAGCDIVGVDRKAPTDTGDAVRALGRRFEVVEADLAKVSRIPEVMEQALTSLGKVDVLVNNAGIIRRADALDFTEADWDVVMDMNIKAVFFLSQTVARHMLERAAAPSDDWHGGKIINIASLLSFQGGVRVSSYTASKSGVMGITRLMANEWAAKGINVNAVVPGYIVTGNTTQAKAEKSRESEIVQRIPAGRWGEPADLGGATVFLASPAANYVHGHALVVDGGWMVR